MGRPHCLVLLLSVLCAAVLPQGSSSTSSTHPGGTAEAALPLPLQQARAQLQLLRRGRLQADPPCPAHPSPVPLPAQLPAGIASALASVNEALTATLQAAAVPGASLAIYYRGAPLFSSAVGVSSTSPPTPMLVTNLFRIGSVSKVFPALSLYLLAERDALQLDDAVASYAPDFSPRNPFDAGAVTFRHLASQMSGLQREAPYGANTTATALAAISSTFLILPPGAEPSYSNLGFGVLAHVLAEFVAAGRPSFPELVQQLITGPLDMRDSGFNYTPEVLSRLATGYLADGSVAPFADLGWQYPAGSMYSSVEDLSALATAILVAAGGAGGTQLSLGPERAREMLSPVYWNRDRLTGFGTPWEIRTNSNYTMFVKGGNLPGYSSALALVPDLALSLTVAWNGGADEFAFVDAALSALLPPLVAELTLLQPSPPWSPGPNPMPESMRGTTRGRGRRCGCTRLAAS